MHVPLVIIFSEIYLHLGIAGIRRTASVLLMLLLNKVSSSSIRYSGAGITYSSKVINMSFTVEMFNVQNVLFLSIY